MLGETEHCSDFLRSRQFHCECLIVGPATTKIVRHFVVEEIPTEFGLGFRRLEFPALDCQTAPINQSLTFRSIGFDELLPEVFRRKCW
jgi:hypothetical protein